MGTKRARAWILLPLVFLCFPRGIRAATLAPGSGLALDLVLFDGAGLSDGMHALIQSHVGSIFSELGIEVGWVDRLANPDQPRRTHEIKVILVDVPPTQWGFGERAMGAVLGRERTAVHIFVPNVIRALKRYEAVEIMPYGHNRMGRESHDVACALGRVIAHELIHTLTPGLRHARDGLMKRRLDRHDLMSKAIPLDPSFAAAMRRNLAAAIDAVEAAIVAEGGGGSGSSP